MVDKSTPTAFGQNPKHRVCRYHLLRPLVSIKSCVRRDHLLQRFQAGFCRLGLFLLKDISERIPDRLRLSICASTLRPSLPISDRV
ncbi:Unknown protein sequence [Pseudomonas syringae pv. spinaceae]|uniref:Uncharacterized protein n=1 Tax=Pseudomonas syringae pv. spinaceae TaxID=264459 RepID=A0A0N8T667_PSESX|nr:Unknown protein sequence [Pseudomonas syringae pv. spinaceae]